MGGRLSLHPEAHADPLRDALQRLRLEGAIFLRGEFTGGWGFESPSPSDSARLFHFGFDRVILFHVIANGRCWVAVDDGERHWASSGDVIVLPYGDQHRMGGVEPAKCVPFESLITPPPWTKMPVLRHGQGDTRTDLVCGCLYSEDPLFNPALRALPSVLVVRPTIGPGADWVKASFTYALEESSAPRSEPMPTRLAETLLIEILRLHLATARGVERGWIAALRDPVLAPAMALIHANPEADWTVKKLAAEAAVSRSVLAERFRQVIGRSPIRYLTDWRMHVAAELLATTEVGIGDVARRVGYEAEEAFSRAFKRAHGRPPSTWRAAHS